MTTYLIDADIVAFKAAAATEQAVIGVIAFGHYMAICQILKPILRVLC